MASCSPPARPGLATPRGPLLAALALLCLAARATALREPYALHAALDVALLPLVALILADRLLRAGNRRNLPLVGLLLGLAAANAAFHAAVLGCGWACRRCKPCRPAWR